jgi:hypothetical protein
VDLENRTTLNLKKVLKYFLIAGYPSKAVKLHRYPYFVCFYGMFISVTTNINIDKIKLF